LGTGSGDQIKSTPLVGKLLPSVNIVTDLLLVPFGAPEIVARAATIYEPVVRLNTGVSNELV
jgi:hypothetical protein